MATSSALQIANALNVTSIEAGKSNTHAAMRHAEAQRQADLIDALAAAAGLNVDSLAAKVLEETVDVNG